MSQDHSAKVSEHNDGDAEWFATAFSLSELRDQFRDSKLQPSRREHAFYRYWLKYLEDNELTDTDIEELLAHREWELVLADIVDHACQKSAITPARVNFILAQDRVRGWLRNRLTAFLALNDSNLSLADKLRIALSTRTEWAVAKALHDFPTADALQIIEEIPMSNKERIYYTNLARKG